MAIRKRCAVTGVLLAVAVVLAGCGSVSSDVDSSTVGAEESAPADIAPGKDLATAGALIPIDSDNVFMAGYSQTTGVMTVLFRSGGMYEYYDVPPELWQAFVNAQPDPWSLVGYPQLVQQGYAYRKIAS